VDTITLHHVPKHARADVAFILLDALGILLPTGPARYETLTIDPALAKERPAELVTELADWGVSSAVTSDINDFVRVVTYCTPDHGRIDLYSVDGELQSPVAKTQELAAVLTGDALRVALHSATGLLHERAFTAYAAKRASKVARKTRRAQKNGPKGNTKSKAGKTPRATAGSS
jgi:hypothetical protein